METIRLTTADAIVRWMVAQQTKLDDGSIGPLFPGVFAIFGHGNVTCLGHALEPMQDQLPTWRGQNEQGMALAGVAYAKAVKARQIMVATSSVGPGATNMITACGVASANRLPLLVLAGDTFTSRVPDPVLQQVENFGEPSTSVNDGFRAVVKYWDRITHPAQIVQSLPAAVATMLDPGTRGPAFLGLPQDVQAIAFDYPVRFFETTIHEVPRPRADISELSAAAQVLQGASKPLIVAGGGVHYSVAEAELARFAAAHNIPVVETVAGKTSLLNTDRHYVGPVGVTGCEAANNLAAEADVVLVVGSRLQDFTTGSWTIFSNEDTVLVGLNTARFDAIKHRSLPVVGDARDSLRELSTMIADYRGPEQWMARADQEKAGFEAYRDEIGLRGSEAVVSAEDPLTYAQVVRTVSDLAGPHDVCVAAAGGFPGEVNNGWVNKGVGTFDCEYGFSCMGYEISGGWGAAMAHGQGDGEDGGEDDGEVFVFVGDGSYLMMNSDLYSSVLGGHKMIVLVCDNAGYAVINRLQINQGGKPFNNLLEDVRLGDGLKGEPVRVDFAAHARSMGCEAEHVVTLEELQGAIGRARAADRTTVISMDVSAYSWTEGGSFWEVAVPEVSDLSSVQEARQQLELGKRDQRIGW